ncbi:MAG TPA: DNA-processing protein DprA, partial [Planctomycetota bacterium]|nr:DNA-processing protein DprA [Planctomycetota bacterium]
MKASPLHLVPGSPSFPEELRQIDAAPVELWARGKIELLERRPRVAIVGTRSPTPYGEAQAVRFARALAAEGVCVVSGLARGIDQAAHAGALDAGGPSIAVLGSGVDRPWPEGELAERMAREGLLLSEFAPGQAPRRHHFPLRNRLISALSRFVLVVEAAHASGSLITARWAADQGRTVGALPGRIDHPMARGCHRLIREGAQLIETPDEVLEELGLARSADARPAAKVNAPRETSPTHAALLTALQGETLAAEELAGRCELTLASALTGLVELELAGAVIRGAGGLYRL